MSPGETSEAGSIVSAWEREPPEGWGAAMGVPHFELHELLPSTNDRLRELSRAGAAVFTTVVARGQSAGRGRSGKRWHSAPDCGLWISVLLPAPVAGPASGIGIVPLAVGISAARAVEEVCGLTVGLKWPNDLFHRGKKFGGILCEWSAGGGREVASTEGSEGSIVTRPARDGVMAGIGINLRRPPGELPEEMVEGVSFLEEECGGEVAEPVIAATLLRELRRWMDPPPDRLEGSLRSEWELRDVLRGRSVQVIDGGGRAGVVLGVTPGGALLLEGGGEVFEVRSGTIRLADPTGN